MKIFCLDLEEVYDTNYGWGISKMISLKVIIIFKSFI